MEATSTCPVLKTHKDKMHNQMALSDRLSPYRGKLGEHLRKLDLGQNQESWKGCCNCLLKASDSEISGCLFDSLIDDEDLCFVRNLISKWSRSDIKKMTARITMIKRIAGLILLPDDDDGLGCFW